MRKYNVIIGDDIESVSLEAILNKLGGVQGAKRLLRGELMLVAAHPEVATIEAAPAGVTIDCGAAIPASLIKDYTRRESDQIASAIRGKIIIARESAFELFLAEGQKAGKVKGTDLRNELRRLEVPVYGIAALEQMRAQGCIPESLKKQFLFAWGDVLRDRNDNQYVRGLFWYGDAWVWGDSWLGNDWYSDNPAVCGQASA